MSQMSGLDFKIREMAERIRALREITRFTPEEMAMKTDCDVAEYLACERGERDLNFAFIYRCALAFGGSVVASGGRAGEGFPSQMRCKGTTAGWHGMDVCTVEGKNASRCEERRFARR